jgi:hypothetical protein
MKITHVEYKALYNLGNYNNESIALRATVEEGETPDEVVEQLREKAIALNVASGGTVDELYDRMYRYRRALEGIQANTNSAIKNWNQTAEFLRAQGINPEAPDMPLFPSLLSPAAEEVVTPENDDICF